MNARIEARKLGINVNAKIEARLRCAYDGCSNDARYIDEHGYLCCSLCAKHDSIRLTDVPRLLAWARRMQIDPPIGDDMLHETPKLLGIIGPPPIKTP